MFNKTGFISHNSTKFACSTTLLTFTIALENFFVVISYRHFQFETWMYFSIHDDVHFHAWFLLKITPEKFIVTWNTMCLCQRTKIIIRGMNCRTGRPVTTYIFRREKLARLVFIFFAFSTTLNEAVANKNFCRSSRFVSISLGFYGVCEA